MSEAMKRAAARVVAEAELLNLKAVRDQVDAGLEATRREMAACDRIEPALVELERLDRLYPRRTSPRELLADAHRGPGLEDDDPELIDRWMREKGLR